MTAPSFKDKKKLYESDLVRDIIVNGLIDFTIFINGKCGKDDIVSINSFIDLHFDDVVNKTIKKS